MLTTITPSSSIATRLGKAAVLTVAVIFALTAAAPSSGGTSLVKGQSQEDVNAVLDPVILNNYDIYAESGFNDNGTAYIAFTNPLPADARAIIQADPAIQLIENAAMTADDAAELMVKLFSAAESGSGEGLSVFVHVNPITANADVSSAQPLDEATQAAVRKIATDAQVGLADVTPQVTFSVDESLSAETDGTTDMGALDIGEGATDAF